MRKLQAVKYVYTLPFFYFVELYNVSKKERGKR